MTDGPTSIPAGLLRLIRGTHNPCGAAETHLFLFEGDATTGPVRDLIFAPEVTLPARREDLNAQRSFRLKILHINDLHGHVTRFTPYGDRPVFSKIVWRLRQLRSERQSDPDAAVVVLSAGDDLVGSVFDELLADDPASYLTHAGYRLYSAAGVDLAALGNHDLDMGAALLARAIRQEARFPVLAANLSGSPWLAGLYYPAALLVVKGVRLGFIGLITPAGIRAPDDTGLQVTNPLAVVHNLLPIVRPLCDVLIIISHLGYSLETGAAAVREAGDIELARSLSPGAVHLIVGGHTHLAMNEQGLSPYNIINGTALVQAGTLGRYLGEVDITLGQSPAVTNVRLTPTADLPVDEAFEHTKVQPLVALARPLFSRKLGRVANQPDLSTEAVRNCFAAGESALANFIADAMVTRCRANGYEADLALIDGPSVRCGLPTGGELTFGDWFNLMPFADTIQLWWLTGRQLKMLLNDNAQRADRPGEPHTERGFLHFSRRLRYTIDLGPHPFQAHAPQITVDNIPLDQQLGRTFIVASSSFVRQAASPWESYVAQFSPLPLVNLYTWPRIETNLFLRTELVTYIREHGGVTELGGAKRDGRVSILTQPGDLPCP